jgi:LPXTG-motif cell wall-anchored protein
VWRAVVSSVLLLSTTVVGAASGAAAIADGSVLTVTPTMARVGDPVVVSGQVCAVGQSVTEVSVDTVYTGTDRASTHVVIDLASLSITQTDSGFSFTYIPTEAEVELGFQVSCSDGATAASPARKVWVFGPSGRQWFLQSGSALAGVAGTTFNVVIRSMDCVEGSLATVTLGRHLNTLAGSVDGTFTNGVLDVMMLIYPPSTSSVSDLEVRCGSVSGGVISDLRAFTVIPQGKPLPATGGVSSNELVIASLLVLAGLGLVGRRRDRRTAKHEVKR